MKNKLKNAWLKLGVAVSSGLASLANMGTALADGFQVTTDGSGGITIKPGDQVSLGGNDWKTGLVAIIDKYKGIAQGILAFCAITALVCLIISITRLSTSSIDSAPHARRQATIGLLVSGIALALFGGLSVVVGFFWNVLI